MVQKHQIIALQERKAKLDALYEKWSPHPKQQLVIDALKAGKKKFFIRAGRRSGKTFIVTFVASLVAGLGKKKVCSIITPSLKQGKKIYWKKRTLQEFMPKGWIAKENNEDLTIYTHDASYVEVDGSENIDAHRGDEKDLVVLDEYKDIDPRFYSEVVEPMLLTTDGIVIIIGTPPETPESHFRDLENHALNDDSWECIHWTSYDSPYCSNEWLDNKRAELAARGELDVFKREYLAEYTTGGKNSVFPMLSRQAHLKTREAVLEYYQAHKSRIEIIWGNDPGTSTTFGSLFVGYHREAGRLLFLNEIYAKDKQQMHTGAIVEQAEAKIAPFEPSLAKWTTIYDDAAVWFANELLYEHDLVAFPANKAAVQKEEGIGLFKTLLLTADAVWISEDCENFFRELENYIMVNGKYPLINDHLIDTCRYTINFLNVLISLAGEDPMKMEPEDYEELFTDDLGLGSWMQ